MASVKIDQLLQALSQRLPPDAHKRTVEAALRAAIDGLPKSKTRDRLLRDQKSYIYQLFGLVRQRRPEGATDSKEDDAGEDKKAEQDEEAEEQEDGDEGLAAFGRGLSAAAVAAYAGVDGDSPSACLLRCEELLAAAL
ncbi:unnamed protein product, partial [Polarella glacialis]